ncbi:hypothetical protein ACHAXS_000713 [Conticribra weissflogii]
MSTHRKGARMSAFTSLFLLYLSFVVRYIIRFRPQRLKLSPEKSASTTISELPKVFNRPSIEQVERSAFKPLWQDQMLNFASVFRSVLLEEHSNAINKVALFAALIVQDGKVYCRRSQTEKLSRGRYFVQMLQQGLLQKGKTQMAEESFNKHINEDTSTMGNLRGANGLKMDDSLDWSTTTPIEVPILLKHDDSNGCNAATHSDKYGFPRLTWSIPSKNESNTTKLKGVSWCSAIGIPPFKSWRDLQNAKKRNNISDEQLWDITFQENDSKYPWSSKRNQAVWRGSTTFNKALYGHLSFRDLPRSKLVQVSQRFPNLIDAGFHKLVGRYYGEDMNLKNVTRLVESIALKHMMKYKV